MLTTAGKLVFAGDASGNIVAHDAADRQAAVALAHRQRDEPAADLHARRPSVPARGGRRDVGRIHAAMSLQQSPAAAAMVPSTRCPNKKEG